MAEENEHTEENQENEGKKSKLAFLSNIKGKVKLPALKVGNPLGKISSLPKKKKFIVIGASLFIIMLLAILAFLFFLPKDDSQLEEALQEEVEVVEEIDERELEFDLNEELGISGGKVLEFEEMIVNISGTSASGKKTTRFLKLKVSLVVQDNGHYNEVESRRMYMRDAFQDYLRQIDEKELNGSLGLMNIKMNLLKRAKTILGNKTPREVLILDLVVQ